MRTIVLEHPPEPSEAEVQKAAYYLWLEHGRPAGQDLETWLTAKELLRHRTTVAQRKRVPVERAASRRLFRQPISRS